MCLFTTNLGYTIIDVGAGGGGKLTVLQFLRSFKAELTLSSIIIWERQ
jgi:hypothetical protein